MHMLSYVAVAKALDWHQAGTLAAGATTALLAIGEPVNRDRPAGTCPGVVR